MNRILILSGAASDLSELILRSCPGSVFCTWTEAAQTDWDAFDAVAVLGGMEQEPYTLHPRARVKLEQARQRGIPVFCEYIGSVGDVYAGRQIHGTTHQRLVYREQDAAIDGLVSGDVLDGHLNDCCDYTYRSPEAQVLLSYHNYVSAHDHVDMDEETYRKGFPALWMLSRSTMICGFRLSSFRKARFAPQESWKCVLRFIVSFLAGEAAECAFLPPVCTHGSIDALTEDALSGTIRRGLDWYSNADILIGGGKDGAWEGFRHQISARDGSQLFADSIRTDCCAEISGAFMLDWLTTGNRESKAVWEALEEFCYTLMQVQDGPHKGMLRWTATAWLSCYNDDTARVVLPALLCQNYTEEGTPYFAHVISALQYLLDTTCPNGLRYPVSNCCLMTKEKTRWFREEIDTHETKAHHNAFHLAMFLLAYRAGGPEAFREAGIRGLTTIMKLFPYNSWETSETEELCRLILPLAVLYQITGEAQHKTWLYDITERLSGLKHPSGGYREWDSDYHADCSRRENGECALLAENGDPVADLLYSNNWLPLGFAYAYLVTGDKLFRDKWADSARFFVNCQIRSEDKRLDGAWARAFDLNRQEIYGVPHDIGWAPCCIESGWTVGEILMGLQFMAIAERERNK